MEAFREDLLGVWFVSEDGSFALELSCYAGDDDPDIYPYVTNAFRAPKGSAADARLERTSAERFETHRARFTPPNSPGSSFAPYPQYWYSPQRMYAALD